MVISGLLPYFGVFSLHFCVLQPLLTSLCSSSMARSKGRAYRSPRYSDGMAYVPQPLIDTPLNDGHPMNDNHPEISPRMAITAYLSGRPFPTDNDVLRDGWRHSLYKAANSTIGSTDTIDNSYKDGVNEKWYGVFAALKEPPVHLSRRNLYAPFFIPGLGPLPVCFERDPRDRLQDLFVPLPNPPASPHDPINLMTQPDSVTSSDKRIMHGASSSDVHAAVAENIQDETNTGQAIPSIPQKRGPGRPPGSKNKPSFTIRIPSALSAGANTSSQINSSLVVRNRGAGLRSDERSRKSSQSVIIKPRRRRNTDAGDEELEKVLDVKKMLDREDYAGRLRRPRGPGPKYADSSLSPPGYSTSSLATKSSRSKERKVSQSMSEKGKEDIPVAAEDSLIKKRGPGRPRKHPLPPRAPAPEKQEDSMLSSDDIPLSLMAQCYAGDRELDGCTENNDIDIDGADSEHDEGTTSSLSSPPSPYLSFSASIHTCTGPMAPSSRTTVSTSSPIKAPVPASLSSNVNTVQMNTHQSAVDDPGSVNPGDYEAMTQLETPGSRASKETPLVDLMLLGKSRGDSTEPTLDIDVTRADEYGDMSKMEPSARSDYGSDMDVLEGEIEDGEILESRNILGIAFL